jgi:hypothetical protein
VLMLLPGNPGADAGSYPAAGWWTNDTRANGTVTVDGSVTMPSGRPGWAKRTAAMNWSFNSTRSTFSNSAGVNETGSSSIWRFP